GRILLALCCVRTATVYAGLLPEAVSNGYQYNRPTAPGTTTFDEGAFTDPTGVGDYSNRGNNGYPRDSPSERLTLPPFTTTKTTPTINFASGSDSDGDSDSGNFSDSATGSPRPYNFQYRVFDPPSGNDYGQQESSDGNVVRGEYRVLLPDSRTQIVKYTADDANGYNADVQYEGQVQYPNGFFPGTGTGTGIGTG
ncbi:GSCOCG00013228001-RA-CDS, partial [Cotesia congregata]